MQHHNSFSLNHSLKFKLYSLVLITVSLLIFTILGTNMKVNPLSFSAPAVPNDSNVTLIAEAISVDPMSRTITMDWYPSYTSYIDCSGNWFPVYDVQTDPTLLDSTSPTFHDVSPYPALSRLNKTEDCIGTTFGLPPSFRTVTRLVSSNVSDARSPVHKNLQGYPFDIYVAPFVFYVKNVDTGAIIAPNVTKSFGVAVNFQLSLSKSLVIYNRFGDGRLYFELRIERSRAIKVYTIMVAITNWLVATAFLIISASTLVYDVPHIYSEIFVVPVGALFAFTSVRVNLPGAPPGFGTTMDLYSTLPVLIIISLCSVFLLLTILLWRIKEIRQFNVKDTIFDRNISATDEIKPSSRNSIYYRTFVKHPSYIKRNTTLNVTTKPIQEESRRETSISVGDSETGEQLNEDAWSLKLVVPVFPGTEKKLQVPPGKMTLSSGELLWHPNDLVNLR
ncbi:hypothetical protein BDQ17DRAFT_1413775 [Cyathus striatus]|nr:hypothetical protein BDQ17DRAFT_1413775 [Cyathus striatus]